MGHKFRYNNIRRRKDADIKYEPLLRKNDFLRENLREKIPNELLKSVCFSTSEDKYGKNLFFLKFKVNICRFDSVKVVVV